MPNGLFTSTNFEDTKGFIDEPLNLNGQRTFSDHTYGLDHPEGPNEGQNKRNFYILMLRQKKRWRLLYLRESATAPAARLIMSHYYRLSSEPKRLGPQLRRASRTKLTREPYWPSCPKTAPRVQYTKPQDSIHAQVKMTWQCSICLALVCIQTSALNHRAGDQIRTRLKDSES
ncbi:hypothetical protein IRJ41_011664 [Triplophysa rosa]|uniref:Uncharacterized protein n=1 Tax=Triplophysa rosa TaxID=992332 RepID=A0A9W8C6U0_TRIRA|nr:hypothetical protein IRJ41_011664 [Triplophysa rosa]